MLTIKPMIVTGDGQSFESVADAQAHELSIFVTEELGDAKCTPEQVSELVANNWDKIKGIMEQKPKKATGKGKRTRKAKAVTIAPGAPATESTPPVVQAPKRKPHVTATATGGEVPSGETSPGTRIEPSAKWKDK